MVLGLHLWRVPKPLLGKFTSGGKAQMNNALFSKLNSALFMLQVKVQDLIKREEGQDLVEYALIVALISVATVTAGKNLAAAINNVFISVTSSLNSAA